MSLKPILDKEIPLELKLHTQCWELFKKYYNITDNSTEWQFFFNECDDLALEYQGTKCEKFCKEYIYLISNHLDNIAT